MSVTYIIHEQAGDSERNPVVTVSDRVIVAKVLVAMPKGVELPFYLPDYGITVLAVEEV